MAPTEFVDAAEAQARSLGAETSGVYVEHPIQDRTDDEMIAIADEAFEKIVAKLLN